MTYTCEGNVYLIPRVAIFFKNIEIFKMHSDANVTDYKTFARTLLAHVTSADSACRTHCGSS